MTVSLHCQGRSAMGTCQAPAKYLVREGPRTHGACGRHVSWILAHVLVPGREATVKAVQQS